MEKYWKISGRKMDKKWKKNGKKVEKKRKKIKGEKVYRKYKMFLYMLSQTLHYQ